MKSFKQFLLDENYKVGDSVYVKHPTDAGTTLTGKVSKIHSNDRVSVQHRDGVTKSYHSKDVSTEFGKLNRNPYDKPISEDGMGAGAVASAGPTNTVGSIAGSGDSRLPADQREPGVHLKKKKQIKSPVMMGFRRKPPKI